MAKVVLYLAGITFTLYGLACLVDPGIAARAAGLELRGADAVAEIGAMYGGFQTGFGLFCLLAARRSDLRAGALWALLLGIGLLAVGRSYHALIGPEPGAYTWGAIAFESLIVVLSALALRRG
jgi:hypothetical protein